MMEKAIISAVTHDASEAKVTVVGVPDKPGMASAIFRPLSDARRERRHDRPERLPRRTHGHVLHRARGSTWRSRSTSLRRSSPTIGAETFTSDEGIARVSLIGAGMKSHPGVAADMFESLADAGVNIEMISTSPIRISCVIREDQVEQAVNAVHERFRLSDEVVSASRTHRTTR